MADLTPKGYCDVADVEAYTLTEILDSFEPNVSNWIRQMEAYIERITGRNFIADETASARIFDGSGRGEQPIDECISVESVSVNDEALVDGDDFMAYPYNEKPYTRIIGIDRVFYRGVANISVSAKWGYSAEVPELIRFATMVLVAGVVNFSNNADGEVKSEKIGEYSVTYKDDSQWSDYERAIEIIDSYIQPYV